MPKVKKVLGNRTLEEAEEVVCKDWGLGMAEKGLLLLLLRYPEDMNFSYKRLMQVSADRKYAVANAFHHLEMLGYVRRGKDDKYSSHAKAVIYVIIPDITQNVLPA